MAQERIIANSMIAIAFGLFLLLIASDNGKYFGPNAWGYIFLPMLFIGAVGFLLKGRADRLEREAEKRAENEEAARRAAEVAARSKNDAAPS